MKTPVLLTLLLSRMASCAMCLRVHSRNTTSEVDKHLAKPENHTQEDGPPSFAILLSMYNSERLEAMYAKRLEWWLRSSTIPIFVVDSANRSFPKEMHDIRPFQDLHFDQKKFLPSNWTPKVDGASTVAELISLDHAWNQWGKLWSTKFDYVVKVTGKYVLPALEDEMHSMHRGRSFIFQSNAFNLNGESPWIDTECIGFNSRCMGTLLQMLKGRPEHYLETKVGAITKAGRLSYDRLPEIEIPDIFRIQRGAGDVLDSVLQINKQGFPVA